MVQRTKSIVEWSTTLAVAVDEDAPGSALQSEIEESQIARVEACNHAKPKNGLVELNGTLEVLDALRDLYERPRSHWLILPDPLEPSAVLYRRL